jgi:hypothetical protein
VEFTKQGHWLVQKGRELGNMKKQQWLMQDFKPALAGGWLSGKAPPACVRPGFTLSASKLNQSLTLKTTLRAKGPNTVDSGFRIDLRPDCPL